MNKTLILLVLSGVPRNEIVEDRVDVLQRSQVYDRSSGEERIDQIGGLRWDSQDHCYHWHWWRLTGKAALPRRDYRRGGWVMTWYDHKTNTFRRVRAVSYRRSFTLYDPETEDRRAYPLAKRRKLTTPFRANPANRGGNDDGPRIALRER